MKHRNAFRIRMEKLDGKVLPQREQELFDKHTKTCQDCQMEARLYNGLKAEAAQIWPVSTKPHRQVSTILEAVEVQKRRAHMQKIAFSPFKYAFWGLLAVLMVTGLSWIFSNVRPEPGAPISPSIGPVPDWIVEEEPTTVLPGETEKTPVQPLLSGEYIQGIGWSPQGSYFAFSMVEKSEDPRSDREFAVIKIFNPETGEICRTDLRYLGGMRVSTREMAAWLPDERMLAVTPDLNLAILSPCEPGYVEVGSGSIDHAIDIPSSTGSSDWILVRGETSFWIFDPTNYSVHRLEGISADMQIRHFPGWSPSGERLALVNPAETGMNLYLIDAATGIVERVIPLDIPPDNYHPMAEWVLEDRVFIWDHSESGPLLVTLLPDGVEFNRVVSEYLGLQDLNYPYDINGMGVVSDAGTGVFYIVLHMEDEDMQKILIYDSSLGRTREAATPRNVILFETDRARMLSRRDYSATTDREEVDLLWTALPESDLETLVIEGHAPRNYPVPDIRLMPGRDEIVISTNQGVSMVAIPDGELRKFWDLSEAENASIVVASISISGKIVVIASNMSQGPGISTDGIYFLTTGD